MIFLKMNANAYSRIEATIGLALSASLLVNESEEILNGTSTFVLLRLLIVGSEPLKGWEAANFILSSNVLVLVGINGGNDDLILCLEGGG